MSAFVRAAVAALSFLCVQSQAHIVLADPAALAGTSYRATLRVGHGCAGSPTTGIQVIIPAGFRGARPMPKPGWALSTRTSQLDQPYNDHGRMVRADVAEISWTATSSESWLPDDWYDEFVLRGSLPSQAGPMWFKVIQTCAKGATSWVDVPSSGTSIKNLQAPAALLEIIESEPATHLH